MLSPMLWTSLATGKRPHKHGIHGFTEPRPEGDGIRAVFDRVHERVMHNLADFPEADLDTPPLTPHKLAKTKLEILMWCGQHEMMHAGQIGLLRRQLGHKPQW